jgi:hypothetical protein
LKEIHLLIILRKTLVADMTLNKKLKYIQNYVNNANKLDEVIQDDSLEWSEKYDRAFSFELKVDDYYSDSSYETDVLALQSCVNKKADKFREALCILEDNEI